MNAQSYPWRMLSYIFFSCSCLVIICDSWSKISFIVLLYICFYASMSLVICFWSIFLSCLNFALLDLSKMYVDESSSDWASGIDCFKSKFRILSIHVVTGNRVFYIISCYFCFIIFFLFVYWQNLWKKNSIILGVENIGLESTVYFLSPISLFGASVEKGGFYL